MTTNLITRAAALIRERYVFPDVGAQIADRLLAVEPGPALAPAQLADRLTTAAQAVNADRHLRIRPRRATGEAGEPTDWRAHYAAEARANAGGIRGVHRLDACTGRIDVAPYLSPVESAEPYVRAAFALLAGVHRLVIDLRDGRGGTPETVALICGFLLGEEPVHLQDVVDRDGTTRQFWTTPTADRLPESTRTVVLTSAATFSGCEELAYNLQALDRAVVVGETTGGGAHPVEIAELPDGLELAIPVARSVNAVTGTNWEQVGVVPDLPCPATESLKCGLAHMEKSRRS